MPQPDFTQDMLSVINNGLQNVDNIAAESSKKYAGASLVDPDMINQYRYQKGFNPMTFNPFDKGNHDRWVAKETWGTALAKGFDGFATRFGNTFVDYWKDYGRMVDALIHWDMDKMLPSESEMYAQHYKDQQDMFKNKVFVPYGEEDGIFNKSGISEFVSNAGFTMGTYAAFATELLVDTVITVLTAGGGAGTVGATVAKAGTKLGLKSGAKSGLKYIDDFFKGAFKVGHMDDIARVTTKAAGEVDNMAKAGKNLTNMSNASKAVIGDAFDMMTFNVKNILKSKSAGEFFLNAAKGVPVIGSGVRQAERIVKAGKAGYGIATMAGMGVRGIQRMANEFNMASTEATFEAISAYGETLDFILKDYHNRHGEGPNGLDFSLMQDKALKSATANYQTNMVVLLATNKIQFGTLFNKFPMHKSWLTRKIAGEGVEGIVNVTTKGVGKVYDTKSIFGGIKTVAKIGKEFGWKKASWEAAKLFRKNFLKFEVTEGVQEIIQESSNIAWKNYYAAQYTGAEKTITEAFGEGLGEQWSKQGLKVFIHGAMTGGIISVPTRIIGATLEQSQKYANDRQYGKENNPIRQAEAQRAKDIETVNKAMWTADYNKSSVSQLVNTLKSSIHMDEAVKTNNEFEWNNSKDNMMIQAAIAANRLGVDTAYTRAIEHMADDMTVDEFDKVMGIKLEDTKYKTPQEYAKSIAKQVGDYSDTVTKVRKEFNNLVDPMAFAPESMNQYAAIITRAKQEEAIEMIAMMRIKGDRNTDRIKTLKEEIAKLPGLESSSQYAFNVLTSLEGSKSELGNIQSRILTIKESLKLQTLTASEKAKYEEQLKDLQEREDDIKTWQSFFTTNSEGQEVFIGETITEEETSKVLQHDTESKKVKDLFRKIINSKNKEDGLSEISEKAFQESSIKLSDIIKLTNQTKSLMDSYNSLYNAEKFQEVVKRMHEGHIKFIVSNNLEYYIQVMDRNILRYLAKKYNISESELAKERELIAGTNYNLNPNEQMNYVFQLDTIYSIMDKNSKMKEDYKNFREQLNLQLENNKAYQELLSLVVDPSKFEEDIKKIESLMKQVGDVIIAFDIKVLSETDPTFAKQDISIEVTPDTITSDDIIRIAAKLNKDMELAPNEAKLYEDKKVKELVDKQRDKIKEIDIEIKDDNPNVVEEEELKDIVDDIISDEEYDKFIDNNEVSDFILQNIASKIIEGKEVSDREMVIFTERTSDIETIIQKLKSEYITKQSDIESKKADIEKRKQPVETSTSKESLQVDIKAKKAEIEKKIIISGTDNGFTIIDSSNIKNENAGTDIDVRRRYSDERYEIEYGIGDDKKSLFSDIHYGKKDSYHFFITDKKTGKRFYIVGISSREIGIDADRNGSLFASIEDIGNIDNITRSLLELELIKQFEIQSKKRKDVFKPLPNDFINKVNAKYNTELESLNNQTTSQQQDQAEQRKTEIERKRQEDKNNISLRVKLEEALLRDKEELERTGKVDNRSSSALAQMIKKAEDKIDKEYDNIILKEFGELEYRKTKLLRDKKTLEDYFAKSPTTDYIELENRKKRLDKYDAELDTLNNQTISEQQSQIEQQKADTSIGKISNTEYEVKVDGVYFEGKKLSNPKNLSHKELIAEDIRRRKEEELNRVDKQNGERLDSKDAELRNKREAATRVLNGKDSKSYLESEQAQQDYDILGGNIYEGIVSENIDSGYIKRAYTPYSEKVNAKYDAELKALETSEIQEKETPLNTGLFPTQSTEELNITYARKKAEQIIEELPEDLLSSIENIEDAKLYLQNIILERLVKYTGKDISNITDKRSTKAIDKIVNEIKQEFFNLMEQERTIVEVESVPDSNITNVNVLSTEGIIEQVQQNTAILVESTEKILTNSKKSSNFVATEETILNVLKEIKNFKC